jgi:hypothetical protein
MEELKTVSTLDRCQNEAQKILEKLWNRYKGFALRNQGMLELSEDALSRILFWIPHSSTNEEKNAGIYTGEMWREMMYGLLSLQRLAMELASGSDIKNSYCMTVQTLHAPKIAATSAGIMLTVVQSIMPTLLAIAQSTASRSGPQHAAIQTQQRKATFRLVVEQVKFALRMYLLVNYWKQKSQEEEIGGPMDSSLIGIMVDGGMYRVYRPPETLGMSWDQAKALKRRQEYIGTRTGMQLGSGNMQACNAGIDAGRKAKGIVVAELLNVARPLLWAWFESKYPPASGAETTGPTSQHRRFFDLSTWSESNQKLLRAWIVCFGMDLISIRLLKSSTRGNNKASSPYYNNLATEEELRNRKMRLFLYALRSPIWFEATAPLLDGFSRRILHRIPLVGSLTETFLLDWILYYQHPFVSEEQ